MIVIWAVAFVLVIFYILWIGRFYLGWMRTISLSGPNDFSFPGISVVLPVRNEELNIQRLIDDLLNQDYPNHLYEVIIVDDHSGDQTAELSSLLAHENDNIKYIRLTEKAKGKKAALLKGIKCSRFDRILTTDADCHVPGRWIKNMAGCFEKLNPDLIAGPVIMKNGNSFFSIFQQLEHISLKGSTAGAIKTGDPVMCSSANMGFKKTAYFGSIDENYEKIPSGDDLFLLHSLQKQGDKKIVFIKSIDAGVFIEPCGKLSEFISQRIRWASNSRHYFSKASLATSLLVFGINFYILFSFTAGFFIPELFIVSATVIFCKSIVDFPFLYSVTRFFGIGKLMGWFPVIQVIYTFYISFTSIASFIISPRWKGRS